MKRLLAVVLFGLLLPSAAFAATVAADDALTISEAFPGNAYLAGTSVRISAPITGDASALGANIIVLAPVRHDALLFGGTIETDAPVNGDLRALGARVTVNGPVGGDIFAAGGAVKVTSPGGRETHVAGMNVAVVGGAEGPVVIYGGTVTLAGVFEKDVQVFAADKLTVAPGTSIKGALEYDAPQEADVGKDVVVLGGITYTGTASFLPTSEEAKTFAVAGAGLFLLIRIVSGMVSAGLAAGLFPRFTNLVADRAVMGSPRRSILLTLLGFACFVATPILAFFLAISFVGVGIALFVGVGYLLLLMVSYVYAGVLLGTIIARRFLKKPGTSWRAALLGMLILHLLALIPVIGAVLWSLLAATAAGAMVATAYAFAFGKDGSEL